MVASALNSTSFLLSAAFLGGGAYCAFLGLGLPNHPYQWGAGTIFTFFAYQRGWFRWPGKAAFWALVPLDLYAVASVAKLFIGSGVRFPFASLRYPDLTWNRASMVPAPELMWQPFAFAGQPVDLTAVQTFLLGLVVVGRFLHMQAFTSWMAFVLLLASVPALLTFQWNWVFPAVALIFLGLYFQSSEFKGFAKNDSLTLV